MPWWIWLILALFMLAMIVAGLIYAALHGLRALKDMSDIGGQLGERVAARAPHPGMGPLEAIQQLTESSNGTSPTP